MSNSVLRKLIQPVVPSDDVVLPTEHLLELRPLFFVKIRFLDEVIDILIQVRIDEMQLRRPVLIEQRNSCSVLDRLLKIVDRNVIAKNALGAFLSSDERCASKCEEHGFR